MIAAKEKDAFKKAGEKKEDKFSRSSTVRRWGSAAVCVFLSEYLQRNDGGNAACICIFLPGDGSLGQRPEMPEDFRSALWVDFGDRCRRRVLHARSDASGEDLECRGDREPDADRDVDPAGRFWRRRYKTDGSLRRIFRMGDDPGRFCDRGNRRSAGSVFAAGKGKRVQDGNCDGSVF